MKKSFLYIFTLIVFLFSLLSVSCSNIADSSNATCEINLPKKTLTLKVVSDDKSITFDNKRTILPVAYNATDLVYYLCYRDIQNSSSWNIYPKVDFIPIDSFSGVVSCNFDLSYYEFQLYALTQQNSDTMETVGNYTRSQVESYSSFCAYSYADLRFDELIYFHLQSVTTSNSYGSVKIKLNHINNWITPSYTTITAGIYNISTGDALLPPKQIKNSFYGPNSLNNDFYTEATVPAGTYNFVVTYTCYDENSGQQVIGSNTFNKYVTYEYSDKITIQKNLQSSANIDIPYFFEDKPEAPSCFIAGYKDPEKETDGFYQVQFAWCDNSFIEDSFIIQLLNAPDSNFYAAPTNDTEWNAICSHFNNNVYHNLLSPYVSEFNCASTSTKNLTSKNLYLPLGNRYFVRICASNTTGKSDWVYLNYTNNLTFTDPSDSNQTSTLEAGFSLFDADTTSINRFRLKYVLENGELSAKDVAGTSVTKPNLSLYESQHNESRSQSIASSTKNIILNPDGLSNNNYDTFSNIQLTLSTSNSVWDCWTLNKSLNADKNATKLNQSITYIQQPQYIDGVKYYADVSGTELPTQPNNLTYDGNAYIRKVSIEPYTGYENVSLFANYTLLFTDNTNYSAYEISSSDIILNFMNETGSYVNIDGTPFVSPYYLSDSTIEDLIVLSKSNIKWVEVNLKPEKITASSFSDANYTVRKISKDEFLYDKVNWNSSKNFPQINIHDDTESGYYLVTIEATSSEVASRKFAYTFLLQITL